MMYNKSEIMKSSWMIYRESNGCAFLFSMTFAQSLENAWNRAKYQNEVEAVCKQAREYRLSQED